MMMIQQSKPVPQNILSKYMSERVPLDKRIEGVYIPTILTNNVCYLMKYIKILCRTRKITTFSFITKRVGRLSDRYFSQNIQAMHEDLYNKVEATSLDFYKECIVKHLHIDQFTYAEELWKQHPEYSSDVVTTLGAVYFTQMILEYIIQYERDWSDEIQNYLGKDVKYVAHDNETCVEILNCIDSILKLYKAPGHLDNYNIQLSYQIFKNKVHRIDVTSMLKEKTDEQ